jgi:CubicO group peptidase (beta-lactamase class C family)
MHSSKKLLSVLLLGVLCSSGVSAQSNTNLRTRETQPDLDRVIGELHKAFYPEAVAPGVAVVVVKDSRVILLKGYGYADIQSKRPVTPQTAFYIASSTKSFFALAMALLDQKGQMSLDAPLSSYLPDVKLQPPLSTDTIKLRNLLTHTHGIAGGPVDFRMSFTGQGTQSELLALLAEHPRSKDGNEFAYGNLGYQIASMALASKLKQGWKEVVQSTVLDPLGMKNTTAYASRVKAEELALPYFADPRDYTRVHYAKADANMHAAGGMITTAEDVAKWLQVQLNNGKLAGKQVFPASVVEETHRLQADQDSQAAWVRRYGYGLGWNIGSYEGETLIHHHGGFSSFYAHISFMPKQRLGVAVLGNEVVFGSNFSETVAQYIYDTLLDLPGTKFRWQKRLAEAPQIGQRERERLTAERTRRAGRQRPLPYPLETYAGVYEHPQGGRMEWRVQNGKLAVSMGPLWSEAEVFDAAKNELRVELTPGRGVVIGFEFADGKAVGLTHGNFKFKRAG